MNYEELIQTDLTDLTNTCLCANDKTNGIKPVTLTARMPVEVWASCHRTETSYDFQCNHTRLNTGESMEFPLEPVDLYSEHPHIHIRPRTHTPHTRYNVDWIELPFESCSCKL
jgi:hypothetical protein